MGVNRKYATFSEKDGRQLKMGGLRERRVGISRQTKIRLTPDISFVGYSFDYPIPESPVSLHLLLYHIYLLNAIHSPDLFMIITRFTEGRFFNSKITVLH